MNAMVAQEHAKQIADARACSILLQDYAVKTEEKETTWVFTYTPKFRIRGGGFRITVSKSHGAVVDVLMFHLS